MKTNLNFALTLSNKHKYEVFLQVEGYEQIKMAPSSQPLPKKSLFEAKFSISHLCQFPKFLKYNYIVNGTNLYKQNQDLIISKKPLSANIYVNDTKKTKDGTNKIFLTFYIHIPSANEHNCVYIVSDSPVLNQNQSYFQLRQVKNSGIWAEKAFVSVFLNQPIVYKYVIYDSKGREISRECGRPHVLFIHSPIAYKNICIYDIWSNFIPFMSFYPRLVKPSEVQPLVSSIKIEFTPNFPAKNVYLQGQIFNDNEELFPDGGRWRKELQIPFLFEKFTYQIGMVDNSNTGTINWESEPIFKFCRPYQKVKQDEYVSNLFFGDPFNEKVIGLYIPLVSIATDPSKAVGNFESLVGLSKWCKKCDIDVLNIHIEQIDGGLIDPIHSNIHIENERALFEKELPQNRMSAIRNAKLEMLWKKYKSWSRENDKEFELFAFYNPKIREKCADNEFAFYVQYTLFKEYSIAFAEIVDIPIQIILDLNASCDIKDQIDIYSHYTQGFRIMGLSQFIEQLTIGDIKKILNQSKDDKLFDFFMNYFCMNDKSNQNNYPGGLDQQPAVLLKTCYSDNFIQSVQHLYNNIDPDFPNKLEIIKEKFEKSEMSKTMLYNLSKIVNDCPATIFLDSSATNRLGKSQVDSMKMIPCAQNLPNCTPNYLSPEMVSEFPVNADLPAEINKKLKSKSKLVIVYFLDFIKAMADGHVNVQIKPMQLIKGHCRCSFGISVSNLMENQELSEKIRNVLYSAKKIK